MMSVSGAAGAGRTECLLSDGDSRPPPYSEVPGTVPLHSGRSSGPPPSYEDVINPDGELYDMSTITPIQTSTSCCLSSIS